PPRHPHSFPTRRSSDLWTLFSSARQFAKLHAEMHSRSLSILPPLTTRLEERILRAKPLGEEAKQTLVRRLKKMPTGDRLCHGDLDRKSTRLNSSHVAIS